MRLNTIKRGVLSTRMDVSLLTTTGGTITPSTPVHVGANSKVGGEFTPGGDWPVKDFRRGGAIAQTTDQTCVSACAEMLAKSLADNGIITPKLARSITQWRVAQLVGFPADAGQAAHVLRSLGIDGVNGGTIVHLDPMLRKMTEDGLSWAGSLGGHMVLIDTIDQEGLLHIRDPWDPGAVAQGLPADRRQKTIEAWVDFFRKQPKVSKPGGSTYRMTIPDFLGRWMGDAIFYRHS